MAATSSGVKRETSRAPQKASSGRMFWKAGFGYSGFHASGLNRVPSKRPTDGGTSG